MEIDSIRCLNCSLPLLHAILQDTTIHNFADHKT